MADEEDQDQVPEETKPKKSMIPMIVIGTIAIVAVIALFGIMSSSGGGTEVPIETPSAEYVVEPKMYQLKDGSYLRLGFSIVVRQGQEEAVKNIIENIGPGRLPNGVTMILGNKTREELISSRHQREAFARELKKMLEERVFIDQNIQQNSTHDTVEVREVLISDYVTQQG